MAIEWRVVYCKPKQEARAQLHLNNQGFRVFLPQLRVQKRLSGRDRIRIEPMFPRYLFISLGSQVQSWASIRSTRGVVGLVRIGNVAPIVPAELIDPLLSSSDDRGVIEASEQQLQTNRSVEITAGPFAGYRGLFECRKGQQRAMVLLDMLNRQQCVEVPMSCMRCV